MPWKTLLRDDRDARWNILLVEETKTEKKECEDKKKEDKM
jgi:hypothetical protein